MNGVKTAFSRKRAVAFSWRWGALALCATLAVVLAVAGGNVHGAPSAGSEDTQLGEAYRLMKVYDIEGVPWMGPRAVQLSWGGHPSTVVDEEGISCSMKGSGGASHQIPKGRNPERLEHYAYKVTFRDLTPDTTYQFWIECQVTSDDGSSVLKVGPKTEITTLKRNAFVARQVQVEAGWSSVTFRWKKPKLAFRCEPMLNGRSAGAEAQVVTARKGEYRAEGLTPGTGYVAQIRCIPSSYIVKEYTAPITVTTKELQTISGFEATRKVGDDGMRVRWEGLDEAKYYLVSFVAGAKKKTPCGTGVWQRVKKERHLQTGLQADTRYKVCLKAVGPGDETISHTESIFARTKASAD